MQQPLSTFQRLQRETNREAREGEKNQPSREKKRVEQRMWKVIYKNGNKKPAPTFKIEDEKQGYKERNTPRIVHFSQ